MKVIKQIFSVVLICCIFSGCSVLENTQPELSGKEKDFCINAIEYFEESTNNLDGEKLKMFLEVDNINNMELMLTHEAALEEYGTSMDAATKNAYWTVVIVNHLMPKGSEFTDIQLQEMNIEIDETSIRGFIDSNVFIKGSLSFKGNDTEVKNIEICMHAEKAFTGSGFIPVISYIKFVD